MRLLVVDPSPASRALASSALKGAGFTARGVRSAYDALVALRESHWDLVISEFDLPDADGAELVRRVRARPEGREVPFYFLSRSEHVDPARALALGAQDLVRKPAFLSDLVCLARLHGGRPARASVLEGSLSRVGLLSLLRLVVGGGRSGQVRIRHHDGLVRFGGGRIVDATYGQRSGERALLRLLTLHSGPVQVVFEPVSSSGDLDITLDALVTRGQAHMRRWREALARLPVLERRFTLRWEKLAALRSALPPSLDPILRLFDGRRSLEEVVDASPYWDLTTLGAIMQLGQLGLLAPAEAVTPGDRSASRQILRKFASRHGAAPAAQDEVPLYDWPEEPNGPLHVMQAPEEPEVTTVRPGPALAAQAPPLVWAPRAPSFPIGKVIPPRRRRRLPWGLVLPLGLAVGALLGALLALGDQRSEPIPVRILEPQTPHRNVIEPIIPPRPPERVEVRWTVPRAGS